MMTTTAKLDALLQKADRWHEERLRLRSIILDCGLSETVKWGKLCYTQDNGNVVMIAGMKEHCALGFFKGALLDDPHRVLEKPGAHSQAMRWLKLANAKDIDTMEAVLHDYVRRAMAAEKAGLKVDFKARRALEYPQELRDAFDDDPSLKAAFEALTPGRQRGYVLHVSAAKKAATRVSRIEKCAPRIRAGKGLNDR